MSVNTVGDQPGGAAGFRGPDAHSAHSVRHRLRYIDWMRGLAILIMIEAHVLDAWTRPADRSSPLFAWAVVLGGFAAPMFLFLAGLSSVLAAGARERKLGDARQAAARVARRGWEILGIAYLFRVQAYLLSPSAWLSGILKVDILNIMGPSIAGAAGVWLAGKSFRRRLLCFAGATLAIALVTPLVRTTAFLDILPPPLQWYLRPSPRYNNFTFFPWSGFVFAGGLLGVLIDRPRAVRQERHLHALLALAGAVLALASYAASYLPSIYPDSRFWTSSPTFFFLRAGILVSAMSIIYFYEQRRPVLPSRLAPGWSPLALFGQSSLFVYWVHVELVYGIFTHPVHHRLSFGQMLGALALFVGFMFGLTLLKNRAVAAWRERRARLRKAADAPEETAA